MELTARADGEMTQQLDTEIQVMVKRWIPNREEMYARFDDCRSYG